MLSVDEGECEELMVLLADIGLLEREGGRYGSPLVDGAAESSARRRVNGAKGGRPPKG